MSFFTRVLCFRCGKISCVSPDTVPKFWNDWFKKKGTGLLLPCYITSPYFPYPNTVLGGRRGMVGLPGNSRDLCLILKMLIKYVEAGPSRRLCNCCFRPWAIYLKYENKRLLKILCFEEGGILLRCISGRDYLKIICILEPMKK